MPLYETVMIARQDLSSKQTEELAKSFEDILSNNGGKVVNTEHWGLRTLAYRINKNRKGHYICFHTDTASEGLLEMERNMRLHDDVLRYMSVKIDEVPEDGTVMVRSSDAA
tara:strand:- start:7115 stop:7447 length:333 start_codon:yes stop_codon:yes gene_type:complete